MSLGTFADLKASVATWIKRSDLTATIPDFVTLAEARINRELRTRSMVTRAVNTSVDSEFVTAPADFAAAKSIRLSASPYTLLDFLTPEQMSDLKATLPSGDLRAVSVVGGEFWFLPAPTTAVSVQLVYYAKLPALSDSATTNWLLTAHPDVYLWGALLEACVFLEDDEQVQKYAAMFAAALEQVRFNSLTDSLAATLTPSPSGQVV
jgi:hypothetical protein